MTEKEEKTSNLPVQRECRTPGKRAWLIWKSLFEIDEKYEPIKAVGKGAYGIVCSAKDKTTGEKVAIKKIANCFEHIVDARRTLREVMLLRHLKHENVIGVREILRPATRDFTDLYIVYDLMDTDLHQIIRSKQELTDDHLQYFIYQVLRGLKYVHTANVLHRDLKPSNLLLNATCEVKICDFGLARTSTERNFMTEYVVTRWYRAPELLLSCEHYTAAIDVWSVGCILAELLLRKPIFPGKDYINQLQLIIDVLGSPSDHELTFINNTKAQQYIQTLPHSQRVPFQQMFPGANSKAIDLLGKMLQFDPRNRITVEQALEHPYLSPLHNAAYEPSAPSAFAFTMEDEELDQITLRAKVWDEISIYHPAPRVTADISLGWGRKK